MKGLPQVQCPKGQTFNGLFNRGGPNAVIDACSPSKSWMETQNDPQNAVFEKLRQLHPDTVVVFDTTSLVCSDDPCWLGNDSGELFIWDELTHLTPVGLSLLEAPLRRTTQSLLSSSETSRL